MDKIIELLFKHPILLFVVGAWLVGMLSNAAKAKKKASERRSQQAGARTPAQREAASRDAAATSEGRRPDLPQLGRSQSDLPARSRSQVEVPDADRSRADLPQLGRSRPVMGSQQQAPTASRAPQPTRAPQQTAEDVAREMRRILGLDPGPGPQRSTGPAWPEPQPQPATPRPPVAGPVDVPPPARRRVGESAGTHVDPHVGEGIRDRHMDRSGFTARNAGSGFGSLGGRVKAPKARALTRSRARYSLDDLRTAFVMSEILSPPVSLRSYDSRRPV